MTDIKELTEGRDHFSGKIVSYSILGKTDDFETSQLYNLRLTTDTKQFVYLKATRQYIDYLTDRKQSTATFIGDFLEGNKTHLGCDAIVFWRDEESATQ